MSKEVKKFNQLSSSANTNSKNSKISKKNKESSPSNRLMTFDKQSSEVEHAEIYGQTGGYNGQQQTTVMETRMETDHFQTTMRTQNDLLLEKDVEIRDDVDSILKIEMQRIHDKLSNVQ